MQRYSLLVLDDLGAERDTAYAAEQIFNVVDARVQTGLPLIVTTNLSVAEMQQADSMQLKRVYRPRAGALPRADQVGGREPTRTECAAAACGCKRSSEAVCAHT